MNSKNSMIKLVKTQGPFLILHNQTAGYMHLKNAKKGTKKPLNMLLKSKTYIYNFLYKNFSPLNEILLLLL